MVDNACMSPARRVVEEYTALLTRAFNGAPIKNKVPLQRISEFVSRDLHAKLNSVFGITPIAVWGSQAGKGNRSKFEKMTPGDDVMIVEGGCIKLIGKIAAKVDSQALSRELWKPITGKKVTMIACTWH